MNLARISSLARYLSWADAPYKWTLNKGTCPHCGPTRYLSLGKNPWLTRCLKCRATLTNLSLIPVIKEHFKGDYRGRTAYELSSYGSTLEWLRRTFDELIYSEYCPEYPLGSMNNGILNQDVQSLTFKNERFDLVTSNQVFEHVPDDEMGLRECARVLNPGGALIFSVPMYNSARTERIARIEDRQLVFTGKPEYHDSRIGGAKSSAVFWHHSANDIARRVGACGFRSVRLVDVVILREQVAPCKVIYAVK